MISRKITGRMITPLNKEEIYKMVETSLENLISDYGEHHFGQKAVFLRLGTKVDTSGGELKLSIAVLG